MEKQEVEGSKGLGVMRTKRWNKKLLQAYLTLISRWNGYTAFSQARRGQAHTRTHTETHTVSKIKDTQTFKAKTLSAEMCGSTHPDSSAMNINFMSGWTKTQQCHKSDFSKCDHFIWLCKTGLEPRMISSVSSTMCLVDWAKALADKLSIKVALNFRCSRN